MVVSDCHGTQYLKEMFDRTISYSLERSLARGIDRGIEKAPVAFSRGYIDDRPERVRRLVEVALPVMEKFHLLFKLSRHVMALADERAVIIAGVGDGRWGESGLRCGFRIGTSCSEEHIGTNAVGTSLATGQPMCVIGEQNYIKRWQDSANAATVIRDPSTGKVIGAVCLTCFVKYFHIFSLGIVQAVADVIEERLRHARPSTAPKRRPSGFSGSATASAGEGSRVGRPYSVNEPALTVDRVRRDLVFASARIDRLLKKAVKAARYDSTKLILGESGVGKEVLARFIHEQGQRRHRPFVAVNCAAIPDGLMASELFGYETGAFTGARRGGSPGRFEQAAGGTLYLDEISEMNANLQAYLLRVIEDKTVTPLGGGEPQRVDVQIIVSSNRDLTEMVEEQRFRSDLYHRLNVISFQIPPLRERREDIPRLIDHFLERLRNRYGGGAKALSKRAMEALLDYPWPGNVRELENTIETAYVLSEGQVIEVTDLKEEIADGRHGASAGRGESRRIRSAIREHRGNLSGTARTLGMARSTLYRKMARHGLSRGSW